MKRLVLALGAASILAVPLVAVTWASAQPAPTAQPPAAKKSGGGFGFSSEGGPVDITADHSETFQQERMSVWEGNVVAIQGGDELRTPKLTVYFAERSGQAAQSASAAPDMGRIDRMEAEGPVFFITDTQRAQADHATYNAVSDTVTMVGNVVLLQDKNVVKGEKLVIEQKTGHSTLYDTTNQEKGRVRGVFYPNSTPADPKP